MFAQQESLKDKLQVVTGLHQQKGQFALLKVPEKKHTNLKKYQIIRLIEVKMKKSRLQKVLQKGLSMVQRLHVPENYLLEQIELFPKHIPV